MSTVGVGWYWDWSRFMDEIFWTRVGQIRQTDFGGSIGPMGVTTYLGYRAVSMQVTDLLGDTYTQIMVLATLASDQTMDPRSAMNTPGFNSLIVATSYAADTIPWYWDNYFDFWGGEFLELKLSICEDWLECTVEESVIKTIDAAGDTVHCALCATFMFSDTEIFSMTDRIQLVENPQTEDLSQFNGGCSQVTGSGNVAVSFGGAALQQIADGVDAIAHMETSVSLNSGAVTVAIQSGEVITGGGGDE